MCGICVACGVQCFPTLNALVGQKRRKKKNEIKNNNKIKFVSLVNRFLFPFSFLAASASASLFLSVELEDVIFSRFNYYYFIRQPSQSVNLLG